MELNIYAGNIKLEMKSCPTTWTNGDMSAHYYTNAKYEHTKCFAFIFHNPIALLPITIFVLQYVVALWKGALFHTFSNRFLFENVLALLHKMFFTTWAQIYSNSWISLKSIALIAIDHLYFKLLTLFTNKKGENWDDYFRVVYKYKRAYGI